MLMLVSRGIRRMLVRMDVNVGTMAVNMRMGEGAIGMSGR